MILFFTDEFMERLTAWCRTWRVGFWLQLFPAMAAGIGWLLVAVIMALHSPARVEARYIRMADEALAGEDYVNARMASERLLKLDSREREAHVLRLAKSLAGQGNVEMALAVATQVAPEGKPGFLPARLFIARTILGIHDANPKYLALAEKHLKQVLAVVPDSDEAQLLLGQFYWRVRDWNQALTQLQLVYPKRPEAALKLCSVYLALNNPEEARRWAVLAAAHFQGEAQKQPKEWLPRLQWSEAELMQTQYVKALKILDEGLQLAEHKAYHQFAVRIYSEMVLNQLNQSPTNLVERLQLLQQGLAHDPQNEFLLMQLIRLTLEEGGKEGPAQMYLKQLYQNAQNKAVINYCCGMDAWRRNDLQDARVYLIGAYNRDPDNPIVANNLAYLYGFGNPPDPARGLDMIQRVVGAHPESPVFRETRGQLLVKLQKWPEAVSDLEFARRYFTNSPALFSSLAEVYQQLGKTELSRQYQRLAESMKQP
ncbi:MAG: tetratricopeptide repeat protein [Verrucomicrobiota bacterium]